MTSNVESSSQNTGLQASVWSSSNDEVTSTGDRKIYSDFNNIPTIPSIRNFSLTNVLWIVLGAAIVICLALVIVIPIAILANRGSDTNTTTLSTICPTTAITTTIMSSSLPAQCSNYTEITDPTRSPDYTATSSCDNVLFSTTPIWVRFTGSGGTLLASCPIDINKCGTQAPGWYSGIYPSYAGAVTSGFVCYNYADDYCYTNNMILVTNCNGFYIYYLTQPPGCDLRYCTI